MDDKFRELVKQMRLAQSAEGKRKPFDSSNAAWLERRVDEELHLIPAGSPSYCSEPARLGAGRETIRRMG
jgi:hypothetical protein